MSQILSPFLSQMHCHFFVNLLRIRFVISIFKSFFSLLKQNLKSKQFMHSMIGLNSSATFDSDLNVREQKSIERMMLWVHFLKQTKYNELAQQLYNFWIYELQTFRQKIYIQLNSSQWNLPPRRQRQMAVNECSFVVYSERFLESKGFQLN